MNRKRISTLLAFLLAACMLLSSCTIGGPATSETTHSHEESKVPGTQEQTTPPTAESTTQPDTDVPTTETPSTQTPTTQTPTTETPTTEPKPPVTTDTPTTEPKPPVTDTPTTEPKPPVTDTPTTEVTPDPPQPPVCQHTETLLSGAKGPTCQEEGYTGNTVCKGCGEVLSNGAPIGKLNHSWDNGEITKKPTCMETGIRTFTCGSCKETKTETVETVPHSDIFHDALDGTHTLTCSTCTKSENLAHVPTDDGKFVAKTCTEAAYTEYTCSDCKGTYKVYSEKAEDQPTGHSYGEWKVEAPATCVKTGLKIHSCGCGHSETLETPVTENHSFKEVGRTAPTCVATGSVSYKCEHCDATKTETVPATGIHDYETLASTGDGWTRNQCAVCDHLVSTFNANDVVKAEVKAEDIPDDTAFEVSMEKANIEFPKEVVSQLKNDSAANVEIAADVVTETAKNDLLESATNLTEDQKTRLENVDIYDFGVTVNSNKVSSFEAAVTVTMPYELKEGEDPEGIVIWYVADDGTIEEVKAVYNEETKEVVFSVEHFSFYAVAYQETQAMRCKRGLHDYVATELVTEATCTHFGFTVYKCSCCDATTLDDIVERKSHNYGDILPAHPTCDSGDYSTRRCADCGDVINVKFYRALGHKPDGVATCDTPSVCTVCNHVIAYAKGHDWSDWKTVIEATELTNGLRRRYCLTCGKLEEVKIAATGDFETLQFENIQDIYETILKDVYGFGSGEFTFSAWLRGNIVNGSVTVEEKYGVYQVLFKVNLLEDGEEDRGTMYLLYKDGKYVYVEPYTEGETPEGGAGDINMSNSPDMDVIMNYAEQIFDQANPMVEYLFQNVNEMTEQMIAAYGSMINSALKEAGCEHTVEEIYDLIDSLKTVYVYAVYKMGFSTNLEMGEMIAVPSEEDLLTFVENFMTKTEANGIYTYAFTLDPILDSVNTMLDWVLENSEVPFSTHLYNLLGDALKEKYPEITDWAGAEAKLRAEFPGTMTVEKALDKLITLLESTNVCTIEEFYALVNSFVSSQTGEEFDLEAILIEMHDVTLNELMMEISEGECDLEAFYDQLSEMLKGLTFANMPLEIQGESIPVTQLVQQIKQMLSTYLLRANITFKVDAQNELVEIDIDLGVDAQMTNESGETQIMHGPAYKFNFRYTDDVTFDIPEEISSKLPTGITTSYDEKGNLIIKSNDPSKKFEFTLQGGKRFNVSDLVELDSQMTAELGYNVYALREKFWNRTSTITEYMMINGKYYEYSREYVNPQTLVGTVVTLKDFVNNAQQYIPEDGQPTSTYMLPMGTYDHNLKVPCYNTPIGMLYMQDGVWMIATYYYHWSSNSSKDETTSNIVKYDIYRCEYATPFNAAIESMQLDVMEMYDYYNDESGKEIAVYRLNFNEMDSSLYGFINDSSELCLVQLDRIPGYDYLVLGNEITSLPAHDSLHEYHHSSSELVLDQNGNAVTDIIYYVSLYKKVPTFYVKLEDGVYVDLEDAYGLEEDVNVSGMPATTLPSGKTFYAITVEHPYYDYMGRPMIYGYTEVANGLFMQSAMIMEGETIVDVIYRNSASEIYTSFNDVYNVEDYLTVSEDGTYTISVQLLDYLKAYCSEKGDTVSVLMSIYADDFQEIYSPFFYHVPNEVSLQDMMGGGQHGSADREQNWYEIFNGGNNDYNYKTVLNEDGSFTIQFGKNNNINYIEYRFNSRFPADSILEYNKKWSEKTGLQIYSYSVVDEYSSSYVYKNGKYYYYNYMDNYNHATVDSVNALLENATLESLHYRYDFFDEAANETYRVYEGTVSLIDNRVSWRFGDATFDLFFLIKDHTVYGLKGFTEMGESVLKFESMVPFDQYITSLTAVVPEHEEWQSYSEVYLNDVKTRVYSQWITLVDTVVTEEGTTEEITLAETVIYYYFQNGVQKYISFLDDTYEEYLELNGEVTDIPSNYVKGETRTETYKNGTFTFVQFNYSEVYEYRSVLLAGKYYDHDNSWMSYCDQYMTEEDFNNRYVSKDWVYGMYQDGGFIYFNSIRYEDDLVVVDEQLFDFVIPEFYNETYLGCTEKGYEVYEISFYVTESGEFDVVEEQPDGTVYYEKKGLGALKTQIGTYVPAFRVTDEETGETRVVCKLRQMTLDDSRIDDLNALYGYINVDKVAKSITITAAGMELLKSMATDFNFSVSTSYNYFWFDYYDLESIYLELTNPSDGKVEGDYDSGSNDKYEGSYGESTGSNSGVVIVPTPTPEYGEGGFVTVTPENGSTVTDEYVGVVTP